MTNLIQKMNEISLFCSSISLCYDDYQPKDYRSNSNSSLQYYSCYHLVVHVEIYNGSDFVNEFNVEEFNNEFSTEEAGRSSNNDKSNTEDECDIDFLFFHFIVP